MAKETGIDPPVEKATQAGDLAMLFYSVGMYARLQVDYYLNLM